MDDVVASDVGDDAGDNDEGRGDGDVLCSPCLLVLPRYLPGCPKLFSCGFSCVCCLIVLIQYVIQGVLIESMKS